MPPEINPYQPPAEIEEDPANRAPQRELDYFSFWFWPFVLGLNLILPLMLAWSITEQHGRIGMFLGIGLILTCGWIVCYHYPSFSRRMIGSAFFTGMLQIVPFPHMIAGGIAMRVVRGMGALLPDDQDRGFPLLANEPAGFVATIIVGAFLLIFSFGLLFVSEFMIPSEKRDSRSKPQR